MNPLSLCAGLFLSIRNASPPCPAGLAVGRSDGLEKIQRVDRLRSAFLLCVGATSETYGVNRLLMSSTPGRTTQPRARPLAANKAARRLIEASGTTGERVDVWGLVDEAVIPRTLSAYVGDVLRSLGYRGRDHLLRFNSVTQAMRRGRQMSADGDWLPNYPAPSSYLPRFRLGSPVWTSLTPMKLLGRV